MNTNSIDIGHKRTYPNGKSGGAVTDVRNKRQSSNTIPTQSANILDDLDINRHSAQLVPNLGTQ